jgi:hypothetical protein
MKNLQPPDKFTASSSAKHPATVSETVSKISIGVRSISGDLARFLLDDPRSQIIFTLAEFFWFVRFRPRLHASQCDACPPKLEERRRAALLMTNAELRMMDVQRQTAGLACHSRWSQSSHHRQGSPSTQNWVGRAAHRLCRGLSSVRSFSANFANTTRKNRVFRDYSIIHFP